MKRYALLLTFLLTIVSLNATELLRFTATSFQGWIYTRSDVQLTRENINGNNITLYGDYTLVSPMVDAADVASIIVKVEGRSKFWNSPDDYIYNPTLGSPTIELLDNNGNVLKSQTYQFTTAEQDRNFEVIFDISDISDGKFKLRLACWDSDFASTMAVRKVFVEDYVGVYGDVDGDGTVTSADVTVLYNYLLNNDSSAIVNGDVDGDGSITAGDVTVIYNILLGNE
ncbi:MAG: dockerin type I repeat-containing protein [Muribaculaceae bacterium]|nr:dockerin type I repeat-containing protein [Muribaculaceae bacterium]